MPTMQTTLGSTVSTMFSVQNWRGDGASQNLNHTVENAARSRTGIAGISEPLLDW
jgi:hypothetical protein